MMGKPSPNVIFTDQIGFFYDIFPSKKYTQYHSSFFVFIICIKQKRYNKEIKKVWGRVSREVD